MPPESLPEEDKGKLLGEADTSDQLEAEGLDGCLEEARAGLECELEREG